MSDIPQSDSSAPNPVSSSTYAVFSPSSPQAADTVELKSLGNLDRVQKAVASPQLSIQQTPPSHYQTKPDKIYSGSTQADQTPGTVQTEEQYATAPSTPMPPLSGRQLEGPDVQRSYDAITPVMPATQPGSISAQPEAAASERNTSALSSVDMGSSADGLRNDSEDPSDIISTVPSGPGSKPNGPHFSFTLLHLNGMRQKIMITSETLKKEQIDVAEGDPLNMNVYMLKELIWRQWKDEWDDKPSSPVAIRLIYLGKLLGDKDPLSMSKWATEGPNVIHMTVTPQDFMDDDDGAKGGSADGRRKGLCGCCTIM